MTWRAKAASWWVGPAPILRVRRGTLVLVAAGCAVGAVLIVSFAVPVTTTFTVVAETEYVKGRTAAGGDLSWELRDALLCAGPRPPVRPDRKEASAPCQGAPVSLERFRGYLDIESSVTFEVERLADGPLRIGLGIAEFPSGTSADPPPFRVRLRQSPPTGLTERLAAPVLIRISDPKALAASGSPVALQVLAEALSFGRQAALQGVSVQPLLRTGLVTVTGTTILGNRPYPAREAALKYGDEVSAVPSPATVFSSLIRADERPALQSIFRVESTELVIRGFYSEPQMESLTFLDRLTNDSLLVALWSLVGVGVTVAGTLAGTRQEKGSGND